MTTNSNSEFVDYLLDRFAPTAPCTARRMFGGWGIFREGLMVAIVADGELYLKADAHNRDTYESAGFQPFRYLRSGKPAQLGFYCLTADVIESDEQLASWLDHAWAAAIRASDKKGNLR